MIYVCVYKMESMSLPIGLNIHTNQDCAVVYTNTQLPYR